MEKNINQTTTVAKEDNIKYCIFEKRLCRYASKTIHCFECTAPSDEAMTCNK